MTLPFTVGVVTDPVGERRVRIGVNGMCVDVSPATARALAVRLILEAEKAGAPPPESPPEDARRKLKLA